MRQYVYIPLYFFFIASCIGLLLRWHFITPIQWFNYSYWLHAHSHIMFLGWVLNLLMLAYSIIFLEHADINRYKKLFWVIQLLLVSMLFLFPLQGYGIFSIIASTLHTIAVIVFIVWFFKDSKVSKENLLYSTSLWFVRVSLIFFLFSALGPIAVPVFKKLHNTTGYYLSVYYYLHFQYNGVFMFGVLGLFIQLLEKRGILFSHAKIIKAGKLLIGATVFTYALSTLWAKPNLIVNGIGFAGALLQLFSLAMFIAAFRKTKWNDFRCLSSVVLFMIAGTITLKFILQLISAHPIIAEMAYQFRDYVMAYLHLVLLGIVSLFLLVWYIEIKILNANKLKWVILLFCIGYMGIEIFLVLSAAKLPYLRTLSFQPVLFFFSCFIVAAIGVLVFYSFRWKGDKSHIIH